MRDQSTLSDLVSELSLAPARIAIELNGEVIRRNDWAETLVSEGDRLEVVHFVGGGAADGRSSTSEANVISRFVRFLISVHSGVKSS